MKTVVSFLVVTAFLGIARAEGIEACKGDKYSSERISKVSETQRVDVTNRENEVVGALTFTDESRTEFDALYLCGSNPGYFYVEDSAPTKWVSEIGKSKKLEGVVFNDEYQVSVTAKTIANNGRAARLKLSVLIKWSGENQEDADYGPVKGTLFVNLPLK